IPLNARAILEEPDVLRSYADFNAFLAQQDTLIRALRAPPLRLQLSSGDAVPVTAIRRPFSSLPLYFWWQVGIGAVCLMIGAGVWAFRREQPAAQLLLVSG